MSSEGDSVLAVDSGILLRMYGPYFIRLSGQIRKGASVTVNLREIGVCRQCISVCVQTDGYVREPRRDSMLHDV